MMCRDSCRPHASASFHDHLSGTVHGHSSLTCAFLLPRYVDLSGYNSAKELEALGLPKLKAALQALDLKCGGTLEQRAQRLFAAKGLTPQQLLESADSIHNAGGNSKKRKRKRRGKGKKPSNGDGNASSNKKPEAPAATASAEEKETRRQIAEHEFAIAYLERLLANTVKNTKQYVETRQIRTCVSSAMG